MLTFTVALNAHPERSFFNVRSSKSHYRSNHSDSIKQNIYWHIPDSTTSDKGSLSTASDIPLEITHKLFTLPENHLYVYGNPTRKTVSAQDWEAGAGSVDIWGGDHPTLKNSFRDKKEIGRSCSTRKFLFSLFPSACLACALLAVQWLLNLGTTKDLFLGPYSQTLLESGSAAGMRRRVLNT